MPSIFTESPPRWQQGNAVNGQELGEALAGIFTGGIKAFTNDRKTSDMNFMQAFGRGFMEAHDSNYDLKQKMAMLELDQQKMQADVQHMTLDDQRIGMKEIPEFMRQTGGDPTKILSTSFPWKSQTGAAYGEKMIQGSLQKKIQQEAVDAKMLDVQNKVKIAQIKAQTDAHKIESLKDIAAMREQAMKVGKQYEFEQLQNLRDNAQTQLDYETDPVNAERLQQSIQQYEARMKKLSSFAAQVSSESVTVTSVDADKGTKTAVTRKGPPGKVVTPINPKDPLGILK